MPWEDGWKNLGIHAGKTGPETNPAVSGGVGSWQSGARADLVTYKPGAQSKFPLIMQVLRTSLFMSSGAMIDGAQSAEFSAHKASGFAPRRGPGAGDVIGCGLSMGCTCLVTHSSGIGLLTRRLGAYLVGPGTTFKRPQWSIWAAPQAACWPRLHFGSACH
jgi:hypothetical protein